MRKGVLPFQLLREALDASFVTGIDPSFINPSSIDLPISDEAYRLETVFRPPKGACIRDLLQKVGAEPHDLRQKLEVKVPYLLRLEGVWSLPPHVYGYANPKSSVGRINLFCRTVADKVSKYDTMEPGAWNERRELWLLVQANSFPVLLSPGIALSQMRLFDGQAFLDPTETALFHGRSGFVFSDDGAKLPLDAHKDSLMLSLFVGENMGYACRAPKATLDLSRRDADPEDFFEPIVPKKGKLVLEEDVFYILRTCEHVRVPPELSAELRASDSRIGEFRVHAAGFIDSGWGWSETGGVRGQPITLEIIPHERTTFWHGQEIGRLRYEHMKQVPKVLYGSANSNYTGQRGATLAKFFKT